MGRALTPEEVAKLGLPDDAEEGAVFEASPQAPRVGMGDVRGRDDEPTPDIAGLQADLSLRAGLHKADKAKSRVEMLEKILAAMQTGSLGLGDEMKGAKEALMGGDYRKAQKSAEATVKSAQGRQPVASLAGVVPHMLVPGAGTVMGRLATAGYAGGLSGLGEAEGGESASEMVRDSGEEALTGVAIQGGLEVASPALGKLARMFRNTAESQAGRAIGMEGGITDKMRKMGVGDEEARHALARKALDEGLLDFSYGVLPPSKATVQNRAGDMVNKATSTQKDTLMEATVKQPFDFAEAGNEMRKSIHGANAAELRSLGPAREGVHDILKQGRMTPGDFQKANDVKGTLQGRTNYGDVPSLKDAEKFKRLVNKALRKSIENQVQDATGADIGAINKTISQGLKIEEIAKNAASRAAQRNTVGLGDKIIGAGAMAGGGGAVEGLVQAGSYGTIHNLANQFGNATTAKALDNFGEPLANLASKANQLPAAVGASQSPTNEEEERQRLARYLGLLAGP